MSDGKLKRTPLEAEHVALGAKMGPFAGWSMPIEYSGTLAEHRAVREAVGLFDLTHLGRVTLAGEGALDVLLHAFTNDASSLADGRAQYTLCLNEEGGIVDDLIVYRTGGTRYLVVPNAANRDRVFELMLEGVPAPEHATIREDTVLLAVQGPRSTGLVVRFFPVAADLAYMHCAEVEHEGRPLILARSGYTGEVGFEIVVAETQAAGLWRRLLEEGEALGIVPCGLGARDTLRLEMGYPLHGNDISPDRTPLEAGLSWAVHWEHGFRGREPLLRQKEAGIASRLWGLRMEGRLIPRAHYPVFAGDEQVGETTSGTFSPTLRVGIALAYLSPRERFSPGDRVEVDVRGRRGAAEVVRPPFVERSPK
ncbi:MAG TPA: glycine cleavage system aminomethyltransferase GcvT [Actinomycetota bacterium]|nr:glycine cleavage system aminomethyltransferase GcvT [Actinomycetota bacterium]